MNRPLLKYGVATVTWLVLGTANAQEIPPACQQYLTALKVCGADAIRFVELTQPAQAAQVRSTLADSETKSTAMLRMSVRINGADATAERCATSPLKDSLREAVVDIVVPLSFNRAVSDDCQDAFASLR